MASCGRFDFDDDEKLDSVFARAQRAANSGTWNTNNKPKSSTGKVIRLKRSSVRGIILANEDGGATGISSPRVLSQKQMVAESFYNSVASKTGDGSMGFHLKGSFTGIVDVSFNGGKISYEPVKMNIEMTGRPEAVTDIEKKPKLIPGSWKNTARPRSPYVEGNILFAELQAGSGYGQRAIVVPKKLMLVDLNSFFTFSTGNKDEDAVFKECKTRSSVIDYKDPKWTDVWVGGKNLGSNVQKGNQKWGLRIGNWWFAQQGTGKTNIMKMNAAKCKKDMKMMKRVGCTTAKAEWLKSDFLAKYTEAKPKFHIEKHNAIHMTAAMVTALGLECPFWAKPGAIAKGCVKGLTFSKPRDFKSVRAVRLF